MRRWALALAGLCATVAAAGCASAPRPKPEIPPVTVPETPSRAVRGTTIHTVAPGETLWRISKRYGTTVDAIMAANDIKDVRSVATGARLVVPVTTSVASGRRGEAQTYASRDPRGRTSGKPEFAWPVHGEILSPFGRRHSDYHEGIDIRAGSGTIVRAAESGRVIHADATLAGYGKMIVIKHAGRLSSVYAHNRKLLVEVGQFVEKGEPIAEVGETGNATTPHLHFEIRSDGSPRDPLKYLQ